MRPHLFAVVLSNFLLLLALPPAAVAQDEILAPGFANGIPYLSGGIGDEEREAIDRARNNYNIKLVLAEASGSYVSDVTLHITTVLGEPVISIPSAGPLVLLQLPPGTYLINAAYEGRNAQKRFDVSDNLAQTVNVLW